MYLYIETLKQRLDAINQLRVDRALAAMKPAFQRVYSLLPTLLHHHHPLMPGYLNGTAGGSSLAKRDNVALATARRARINDARNPLSPTTFKETDASRFFYICRL